MNTLRILLLSLVACMPCCNSIHAEAKAVITGPSSAQAGDLVVLDAKDSTDREVHKWILPKGLQGRYIEFDSRLIFATGTQGTYEVGLVVADKTPTVDYAMFEVVIGKGTPPPTNPPPTNPPPTNPPPVPPPTNPGTWDDLRAFSASCSVAVGDPATASKLAVAIRGLVPQLAAAADKPAAQAMVASAIESVFAQRQGDALTKEWLAKWRKPVNAKLGEADAAGRMPTQVEFSKAIEAVANGLGA